MRLTTGDPESFDEAFRPLFLLALSVGRRITGSASDAEDVAAETMARALASWRRVGPLPHRDAWVQRVAANVAVDLLRRRRPEALAASAPFDPQSATDERLRLAAEMGRLSKRQRDVLALRFLADMSEADVARTLGLTPGSVKTHSHRGLSRLRTVLSADDQEVEVAY
jgi:RNA polymerase sigma factor (sigma-70 family)